MADQSDVHEWLSREFGAGSRLKDAGLQAVGWRPGEPILLWVMPGRSEDVLAIVHERFPNAGVLIAEGTVKGIAT